ncbi:hypothetical protein DITRI_Ditri09bG0122800 [Diplodiscus trichospermus]
MSVVMRFYTKRSQDSFLNGDKGMKEKLFDVMQPWSRELQRRKFAIWVQLEEVPLYLWHENFFTREQNDEGYDELEIKEDVVLSNKGLEAEVACWNWSKLRSSESNEKMGTKGWKGGEGTLHEGDFDPGAFFDCGNAASKGRTGLSVELIGTKVASQDNMLICTTEADRLRLERSCQSDGLPGVHGSDGCNVWHGPRKESGVGSPTKPNSFGSQSRCKGIDEPRSKKRFRKSRKEVSKLPRMDKEEARGISDFRFRMKI